MKLLLALLLTEPAIAAAAPPSTAERLATATQPVQFPSVLPDVTLEQTTLDDAVEKLRSLSGLNIVVQRDRGADPAYPQISSLHLKNVTAPQVLMLLSKSYPGIDLSGVDDPTRNTETSVYLVKVRSSPESTLHHSADPQTAQRHVVVYNLSDLSGKDAKNDTRIQNVLSLLEAALQRTPGERALVEYHPPTHSIIVNATDEQHKLVSDTLATQRPDGNQTRVSYVQQGVDVGQLTIDQATPYILDQLDQDLHAKLAQLEKLRQLLIAKSPTTNPS